MKNNNFLLEIYIEDLTYDFLKYVKDSLFFNFKNFLKKEYIYFENIEYILTINRIGLILNNIYINKNVNFFKIIKGPNLNKHNDIFFIKKWIKKFLINKNSIKFIIKDNGIWIYEFKKENSKTYIINKIKIIIINILNLISKKYNFMRWNYEKLYFIRPIRNILMIYNNKFLKFKLLNNLMSNNYTFGNKFNNFKKITVNNIKEYKYKLKKENIIINYEKRKKILLKLIKKIEKKINVKILFYKLYNKYILLLENINIFYIKINKKYLINKNIITKIIHNYYNYLFVKNKNSNKFIFILITNLKYNKNIIEKNKLFINSIFKKINLILKKDIKNLSKYNINLFKNIIFRKYFGNMYLKIIRTKKISIYIFRKLNINFNLSYNFFKKICFLYNYDLFLSSSKEFSILKKYFLLFFINIKIKNYKILKIILEKYYILNSKNFKLVKYNSNISYILNISDKFDTVLCNLYLIFIKKSIYNFENDKFYIKKYINDIFFLLIINNIDICLFKIINKFLYLYNLNYNKDFIKYIKEIFINRMYLFFLNIGYKKKYIKSIICKTNYINLMYIYSVLNLITKSNYNIVIEVFKRLKNLLKNENNIIYSNIKKTKLDNKLLSFIILTNKKINIYLINKNYDKLINKIINLSIFINFLLNKKNICNNNNKNLILLLKKVMIVLSKLNDINLIIN